MTIPDWTDNELAELLDCCGLDPDPQSEAARRLRKAACVLKRNPAGVRFMFRELRADCCEAEA